MKETIDKSVPQTPGRLPVEFQSTQILETLQNRLQRRYDVYVPYNVNQFVCHSATHLQERFNDCCMLLEGVSHFLYLTWNAHYDRQVSLLDLELQAEVDKFVFAVLDTEPDDTSRLLERLYQQISYRDELTPVLKTAH